MRIATISKIKNEADIIESFVRYHGEIVDDIFLIENGSTDGTLSILQALKEEGYPITIFDEADTEFDELKFINKYADIVLGSGQIDWLIPIDADEFLYAGGKNPREYMEKWKTDTVYLVMWRTYIWKPDAEAKNGFVPDRFEIYRDEKYESFTKVIIPGNLYGRKSLLISHGNHDVIGVDVKRERDDLIKFVHYPIRSKEQFKAQIVVNHIMQMSRFARGKSEAWHWNDMYMAIKEKKKLDLEKLSSYYAMTEQEMADRPQISVYSERMKHSFCNDIELRYEKYAKVSAFDNLMCASEKLAERLSKVNVNALVNTSYKKERIVMFGVGRMAEVYARAINMDLYDIVAYADSDVAKQHTVFQGKKVLNITQIDKSDYDSIVITSYRYFNEIKESLSAFGLAQKVCFIVDILKKGWV